jgi:allophanate hydrolase subunit 1
MEEELVPGLRELLVRCDALATRSDRLEATLVRQAHHVAALQRQSEALCKAMQHPQRAPESPPLVSP